MGRLTASEIDPAGAAALRRRKWANRAKHAASPTLGRRELVLLAAASTLLAVLMSLPLALRLDGAVPGELGDPVLQAWQVAWGAHALTHGVADYFQANAFWPLGDSLAFSDALIGYAPLGLLGSGATAAVVHYNLLYLLAYCLAFAGAYLLARELGASRFGAAAAGVAFAYAPWRISQVPHLNILSSGGIPLALFLLVRGYRSGRTGLVLAGWLVAAWQLSLSLVLGIQLAYLLLVLGVVLLIGSHRRGWRPDRSVAIASVVGIAALATLAAALARPYEQVRDDHPEAERVPGLVGFYSLRPASIVAAPARSLVWGKATEPARDRLEAPTEQSVFPGIAVVIAALTGLLAGHAPRHLRVGLGVAVAATAVLAVGFDPTARWLYPFNYLYEYAPGWDGIRVPGRLMTLTTLGLALLAALGVDRIRTRLGGSGGRRAAAVAAMLLAALLVEGYGRPEITTVPPVPAGQRSMPAPQLHLPSAEDIDSIYMYWSVDGFPAIVNGYSAFVPTSLVRLREAVAGFPDRASVEALRSFGVRTVVLHPDLALGTSWEAAASRSVAGLPLRREERGGVVLFELDPGTGNPRN